MTTKRMLIDAAHPEEIRVAVLNGNILEELDVESTARRQLRGNIYLAKVTRVEPSLQAAFVDYGGNRHGFLAFNEIHPDYYQIPVADRDQLLAEEEAESKKIGIDDDIEEQADDETDNQDTKVETIGGDDIDEATTHRNFFPAKRYKIQEVIKRRQILLIQVDKEERGNKGAALTTYISLAGRYCVLMPNTGKGGGISRKIANSTDRKRLKKIISEFDFPQGMAVIVRTAGADRTKAEIKRDYEYLIKLWSNVRDLTLESTAPALIHEEGSIIKRAVRDHYSRDVEEVVIEGDNGYRQAKDLMKILVPSHAKKVQPYKDTSIPIFKKYHIEQQLETMNSSQVKLNSGGYIVIDVTEALIAVDVNSGRATRGRNIEETALKTNLEAATEVARQLRLRDLAGLVVIDFIDMETHRNNSVVERKLKEAMRKDRARIQIGRISPFGLLELSRQRLRPSITETMTEVCPQCGGSGYRRSIESTALHVLRGVEEECAQGKLDLLMVYVHSQVALYILNQKRQAIAEIEKKFELKLTILEDDNLIPPEYSLNTEDSKSSKKSMNSKTNNRAKKINSKSPENDTSFGKKTTQKRRRRPKKQGRNSEQIALDNTEQIEPEKNISDTDKTDPKLSSTELDVTKKESQGRRRRGRRGGRRRNNIQKNDSLISMAPEEKENGQDAENTDANIENRSIALKKAESNAKTSNKKAEANSDKSAPQDASEKRKKKVTTSQVPNEAKDENLIDDKTTKSRKSKLRKVEPEKSYTPSVTVVGETTESSSEIERGGWWNKITGN